MPLLADFEVNSDLTLASGLKDLSLSLPGGVQARAISTAPPSPLLMSITFEAKDLEEAGKLALDHALEVLNVFAFSTGAKFQFRRLLRVIDWNSGLKQRDAFFYAYDDAEQQPTPFLDESIFATISEIATAANTSTPALRKAMRWFRLGVNAENLEDQFQYFWFTLEIVAANEKTSEKVCDRCPKCGGSLFCESCKTHPMHKKYQIQAIRDLFVKLHPKHGEEFFEAFSKARNTLMHGGTREDVEKSAEKSFDALVDKLGQFAWKALWNTFQPQLLGKKLSLGMPTTFIQRTLTGAAHLQLEVKTLENCDLDRVSLPKVDFVRN